MPRGVESQQLENSGTANSLENQNNQNALTTLNTVSPALTHEVTNPQGFSLPDLTALNTANQQSLGGSTAGAVGQGNLEAARTRNAGAFQPALDQAVRTGQKQLSQNALNTQLENAALRNKNQQSGISGLEGLYGVQSGDALKALGLSNEALAGAGQSSQNNFLDAMNIFNTASKTLSTAASGGFGGPGF